MSEGGQELERKVEVAAGMIAGSQNALGVSKAMEIAGFTSEEIKRWHSTSV